jgi:uncharacterized membrane protein YhiD involved in acid resistance
MSIAGWNLVLNAIIAVLLVAFGLWFKRITDEQLRSKDATIEILREAIALHETHVAQLKEQRAPAIIAEHKTISEYADKITAEKRELDKQLNEKIKEMKSAKVDMALAEASGMLLASNILIQSLRPVGMQEVLSGRPDILYKGMLKLLRT